MNIQKVIKRQGFTISQVAALVKTKEEVLALVKVHYPLH